jgi:DNA invertase Pin-like site-specific DNA recombinase
LPHQRKWCEETCASHGWRLTRVIEGVGSGKLGPRKLVAELLADLRALDEAARPARVLMIRADRLGRGSVIEMQIALRDLLALGVGVFTRDQGALKLDSAMDELISAATLAVSRHENEVRREKIVASINRKRAAGVWKGSVAPYGLIRKGDHDVPDSERAPVVQAAFKMRLEGRGYTMIARRLSAIALPHAFLNGKSRTVYWTATRVSNMLSHRAYIGPVVDEETFVRAQQVASVLRNEKRHEYARFSWPLSGAIKCYCGRAMNGMPCGRPPWKYPYYCCRARWNHHDKLRLVRAEKLEAQFVDLLSCLKASPALIERYRRRAITPISPRMLERSIRDLKVALADVERRRDKVWELNARGQVRDEDMQERLDRLSEERDGIQGRLNLAQEQVALAKATASREADAEALIKRAARIFGKANHDEQREIARAVSVELGGMIVAEDDKLKPGAPKS